MIWILLVLLYGILKGLREIAKKKALKKNSVMEVLVQYTFLSFLLVLPQAPNAGGLEPKFFVFIAIKAIAVFLAWICSFHSLKELPVSLYGILDLSRVLFATSFGVFLLGEPLSFLQALGLVIVCSGLLLLKFRPPFLAKLLKYQGNTEAQIVSKSTDISASSIPEQAQNTEKKRRTTIFVILALASCLLNAISGFLDKVLMKDISSSQLQFWYTFFMILYYLIYVLVTRTKISRTVWKNKWIWLLAIMFIIGDKALFIANGIPESRITVMTLIKQGGCIVTILGGYFVFKEKNIAYRLFCATVIIIGILIGMINI